MEFNYAWNWICLTTVTSGDLKAVMYNFGLESKGNFKGFLPACQITEWLEMVLDVAIAAVCPYKLGQCTRTSICSFLQRPLLWMWAGMPPLLSVVCSPHGMFQKIGFEKMTRLSELVQCLFTKWTRWVDSRSWLVDLTPLIVYRTHQHRRTQLGPFFSS